MKAKSIHGKSTSEIQSALEKCMTDGFVPTIAIVFISIKQDRKAISALLREHGIDVLGATSCGEFTDGYQAEGTIVIMLLDMPREDYSILFEDIGERTMREASQQLAEAVNRQYQNPALILCSTGLNARGEYFDGETLVQTMKENLDHAKFFVGGMAGDDMTFTGTYIFTSGQESDRGMIALVMDGDKIEMQGMAITGWQPIGISRTITKSKGNLVYTIDNKSAIEMYLQYLGRKYDPDDTSFNIMNDVSMQYPLIVDRPNGGTVIRTPYKINAQENALEMDIEMPEGTKFRFSMPPDFDIVEEVLGEAEMIKKDKSADALLIFSCAGRNPVLGPLVTSENEGLHQIWNAPMAGFFTYGEYGRDNLNKQEFHSGACSWVALTEK